MQRHEEESPTLFAAERRPALDRIWMDQPRDLNSPGISNLTEAIPPQPRFFWLSELP